jgi:hypothetical protein
VTATQVREETKEALDSTQAVRAKFRSRYRYYHHDTFQFFQDRIQADSTVLVVGLDVQEWAPRLRCKKVLILELQGPFSDQHFQSNTERVRNLSEAFRKGPVDYVLLPFTLQLLDDDQRFLNDLREHMGASTRLVLLQYNFLWAPFLVLAQKLSLRTPYPNQNWLNLSDVRNLLLLSGFQDVTDGVRCLIPIQIPLLTDFVNRYIAPLPGFHWLCQKTYLIARSWSLATSPQTDMSVSIVVPARNEAGNIAALIQRVPALGTRTEVIFVEGHSKDLTWEEIQRQMSSATRPDIQMSGYQQAGIGKADAVRLGFSKASGDILMILDADLSVQPEDLIYFYKALIRGSAEFTNGSRLVYQMEKKAMQILNFFFNKVFGLWLSMLIGQNVKDTLCGTKVLFRKDYERIQRHLSHLKALDPFGDFELLFGAGLLNLKIVDVPVRYKERVYGSPNIRRFRDGWRLLIMCLAFWKERI